MDKVFEEVFIRLAQFYFNPHANNQNQAALSK